MMQRNEAVQAVEVTRVHVIIAAFRPVSQLLIQTVRPDDTEHIMVPTTEVCEVSVQRGGGAACGSSAAVQIIYF